jgi:8-amino-7-oxononanoate synthase
MKFFQNHTAGTKSTGTKRCFAKGALPNDLIDFASNDYLGFSQSEIIFKDTQEYLIKNKLLKKQRPVPVLSGNQKLYQEDFIANFHQTKQR